MPTKAALPLPFTVGAPDQNTLYHFQKNHDGEITKKICKVFSGRGASAHGGQAARLRVGFLHQNGF